VVQEGQRALISRLLEVVQARVVEEDDIARLMRVVMPNEMFGTWCRAQKPRIGPVTGSFFEFGRPAPPRRSRWGDPDRPPGETTCFVNIVRGK
jgi:hypothetical protein